MKNSLITQNNTNYSSTGEILKKEPVPSGTGAILEEYRVEDIKKEPILTGTGAILKEEYRVEDIKFEQYVITIRLSPENKFLGIHQIAIDKDFRDYKNYIAQKITFRIEEYQPEK